MPMSTKSRSMRSGYLREFSSTGSVPVLALAVIPGRAGCSVTTGDVAEAPGDLSDRVGFPVGRHGRHLVARQSLRDAVGTAGRVMRVHVPVRLTRPEGDQALVFGLAPASRDHHLVGDGLRGARVGFAHRGRRGDAADGELVAGR